MEFSDDPARVKEWIPLMMVGQDADEPIAATRVDHGIELFGSIKPTNILTMLAAGAKNTPLLKYLARQLTQSKDDRMDELRRFVPNASRDDWELLVAGQCVQLIEDTEDGGRGALQFGTKLIHVDDRTLAALLGESPGTSVSVSIMLDVLHQCFPDLLKRVHASTARTLGLTETGT